MRSVRFATAIILLVLAAGQQQAVMAGLVISATFDSSITSDVNGATIQATINEAIAAYQASFTDNITVRIKFQEGGGLGSSSTWIQQHSYSDYRASLIADQSTSADATALALLPAQATSPVDNNANMWLTWANLKAIGVNPGASPDGFDGTITLNTSIMNLDRTSINPSKYDLLAVTEHEIDEVLGLGSGLNLPTTFPRLSRPLDLFRYTAAGARTFTTVGDDAYFSIDGTTDLARFNMNSAGDYGDWYTGATPQVQDAFGTAGATPNLGVELTALDVIGYNLTQQQTVTPEPTSLALAGFAGIGMAVGACRRRRQQPA